MAFSTTGILNTTAYNKSYKEIIKAIRKEMPTSSGWYIAGGFAKAHLHSSNDDHLFRDIDIYFTSETEFNATATYFNKNTKFIRYISDNAITLDLPNLRYDVQLIRKEFGPPEQVVAGFDINCAKVYLNEYGTPIKSSTYDEDVDTTTLNAATMKRIFKYVHRYSYEYEYAISKILDRMIANPNEMIMDYYEKKEVEITSLLNISWNMPDQVHDSIIRYLDNNKAEELLAAYFRYNFIPGTVFDIQKQRYSLKTEALLYHKVELTPPSDVLEEYPEIFI